MAIWMGFVSPPGERMAIVVSAIFVFISSCERLLSLTLPVRGQGVGEQRVVGHLVSLLCQESIPQFLRDSIPQALRGEHLHIRHP